MDSHRAELAELSEKDPDFYKFLKEQDADLLEFNESDVEMESEGEDMEIDENEETSQDEVKIGKHTIAVKVDNEGRKIVNDELIDALENVLEGSNEKRVVLREAVGLAIELFQTCTAKLSGSADKTDFVIYSDESLDGIVRVCLKNMGNCLLFLMNPTGNVQKKKASGTTFKYWKKYHGTAKIYLQSLLKFMMEVDQQEALIACIRSASELVELLVHFPKTCRLLMKFFVKVWSRKSLEERAVAFLALRRLCQVDSKQFTPVYKKCYTAYISASRVVSTNAWKNLTFMQKSFSELTFLNPEAAYQLAFAYIRQFAIHLRNAKIAKRKDVIKTVYNWQYILGLYLWASVLVAGQQHRGESEGVEWINELLYPLIQITIGLIDVFVAPSYVPIRLHCVRVLLQLQVNCDVFIPTLSLSTDCLNDLMRIDQKKPSSTKVLQKSTEMRNLIRLTKEMLDDVNYRRRVAKEIFEMMTESANIIRDDPAFFEVYIPVKITLKNFLNEAKSVEHKKMFREFEKSIQEENV